MLNTFISRAEHALPTKRTRKPLLASALIIFAFLFALPASAITLKQAQTQGLVGEANSGYIAIVQDSSPELEKLVNEVNRKRKNEYAAIAKRNKIDISQVAARAAEKLEARLKKGEYYQDNLGRWKQK
ncbi:YdbL family protein [Microbulbifer agarilyticus]|uniref:YdbL family protein n=1 Tax=Microbulbifer agarilyticus TaxID=260552 RepID=UPI001CD4F0D0|nr:YdbL family protein [Microbulbifer agarilyticus]MCA0901178.1 YdbL family protein [Microbulbifer agarilyticus]